jgi:hypothetical protein
MKIIPRYFCLCAAVLAAISLPRFHASAATHSLTNFADAFVTPGSSGSLSSSNYGGAGALGISAPGSAQGEFQSVLLFDLSGVRNFFNSQYGVGQWSLQSVTLQLTTTTPNNGIFNANSAGLFNISLTQNTGWTEGTGTPGSPGSSGISFSTVSNFVGVGDVSLGTFSFGGGNTGTSIFNLNLASDLTDDAINGNLLSIRMLAADSAISYLFDSRNFGTAGARPVLTFTVPEPGSFSIGLTGLVLLGGRRLLRSRRG